nr:hypothetical protein [Chthoniobacterales bacterium]
MEPNRQRKKLWWAILASLFLHLLVAYCLVAFNTAFIPVLQPADDSPVQLTMVDLSATPTPPARPRYLETDSSKETAEPPKEKTFESNANSIAASKVPASGDAPLPSQEGMERPFLDMETHDSSLAIEGSTSEPAATPPPIQPLAPPASEPPKPQPSATPKATPLPEPSAAPEQMAMLTGTPPPPIRDPQEAEETPPAETADSAPPPVPRPLPERPASNYRPQKEETKITGSISNRGPSAVDAVATPLGRYRKQISDAIGARWYYFVKAKSDLASLGTARLVAEVDAKGHIQNLRIASNSSNEA